MKQQTRVKSDSLEQMQRDGVALRRKLGLPGGRLSEEQRTIYSEAKTAEAARKRSEQNQGVDKAPSQS